MIGVMLVKGDSDRLPNKNLLHIGDKPLWKHNVDKMSKLCEEVIVISDTRSYSWIIHEPNIIRPSWLSDLSQDVLDWFFEDEEDKEFLLTQATNPLLEQEFLEDCIEVFKSPAIENLVSINPYTCKPDGNVYLTSNGQLFTKDMYVIHKGDLYPMACDINTWQDYCIANAIYNGRVIHVG